jgi:HK97 family phage major capsid protein
MDKIAELRAKRGESIAALTALIDKMNADDYAEDKADSDQYDGLKADIDASDVKIKRAEEASRLKGSNALQVIGEAPAVPQREPLKRYSALKAFKDRTVDGVTIRADEQAFQTGMFVRALMLNDATAKQWCVERGIVTKAQAEGVNTAGGFLVPEMWLDTIITLRELYGVAREASLIVPMSSDTLNWPRRTGGVTANFIGENTAVTESSATWDNVNLTAKKLGVLVRMSTEIAEDAMVSIADWLTQEIAYAFASKEDDCFINGDGTSTYGGMTGLSQKFLGSSTAGLFTATGHTTADAITATDFFSMHGLLPRYALPNAKIYCHQYFFSLLFSRLAAAGGGNTIETLPDGFRYSYLGFPIVISQKMPSTSPTGKIALYFGDMAKAVAFGERRQVTVKRSDDRYFDTDQIGILGTERFDINVHDVGDGTTAGAVVALKMG